MINPKAKSLQAKVDSFGLPNLGQQPEGNQGKTDSEIIGGGNKGPLDAILFSLLGTPDALLSPEKLKQRQGRRADASAMANSAEASPGDEFMNPPNAGGSGFGLSDIIKLVSAMV